MMIEAGGGIGFSNVVFGVERPDSDVPDLSLSVLVPGSMWMCWKKEIIVYYFIFCCPKVVGRKLNTLNVFAYQVI